jgi:hypothetical protein
VPWHNPYPPISIAANIFEECQIREIPKASPRVPATNSGPPHDLVVHVTALREKNHLTATLFVTPNCLAHQPNITPAKREEGCQLAAMLRVMIKS